MQRFVQRFFGQHHDDDGQATTEYALILLAAAVNMHVIKLIYYPS